MKFLGLKCSQSYLTINIYFLQLYLFEYWNGACKKDANGNDIECRPPLRTVLLYLILVATAMWRLENRPHSSHHLVR